MKESAMSSVAAGVEEQGPERTCKSKAARIFRGRDLLDRRHYKLEEQEVGVKVSSGPIDSMANSQMTVLRGRILPSGEESGKVDISSRPSCDEGDFRDRFS
jgi:hypothetical protein